MLEELKNKEGIYWLKVLTGAVVTLVAFVIISKVGASISEYRDSYVGYGAEPTIQGAIETAAIDIIEALASIGTAVILVFREQVVAKFKSWWNKDKK